MNDWAKVTLATKEMNQTPNSPNTMTSKKHTSTNALSMIADLLKRYWLLGLPRAPRNQQIDFSQFWHAYDLYDCIALLCIENISSSLAGTCAAKAAKRDPKKIK